MKQLILAYNDALDNPNINPLLLVACVVFDFLSIHPFLDGNGRVSRLISLMLLYQNGFSVTKYISFEEQISRHKQFYYDSLVAASSGWSEGKNDYTPFIQNFIAMVYACYKDLDAKFIDLNGDENYKKSERIRGVVLRSVAPLSKMDICNFLPDVSPTTVEAVLGEMVRNSEIEEIGAGRSTKYIAK